MLNKEDKSGQFYLVAAILISAILLGLIVSSNYARGETHTDVNDLKDEIYIESRKVIKYGESQGYDEGQFNNRFVDFSNNYIAQMGGEKSVYFLFGSTNGVTILGYQEEAREVRLISGSLNISITNSEGEFMDGMAPMENKMILSIDGVQYDFYFTPEKSFYFVVSDIIEGSEYVSRG
jgi:hypothetical protein